MKATPKTGLRLPGIACRCGCADLVIVRPGSDPITDPIVGVLNRGQALAAWCSPACAALDAVPGWRAVA